MNATLGRAAWAIAPVLAAGLVHVGVLKTDLLSGLAIPLDHGRGLWGSNKTLRGLLLMPAATAVAVVVQGRLERRVPPLAELSLLEGRWKWGALLGLAYIGAELPNSFAKRRLGIPAGQAGGPVQYMVDQGDSVLGCLLALHLLARPPRRILVTAAGLGLAAHMGVDLLMRGLSLRR